MSYKLSILFFFLLIIPNVKSQTTYFIKYKDNVDKTEVEEKVNSKQIFTSKEGLNKISNNNCSVGFFAKGLGKIDERLSKIIKVTFKDPVDSQNFLTLAQSDNTIEYVQPATVYQVDYVPNDSLINEQWALQKIQAFDAWNITQGSDTVLLAIIDTGIEFFHPDLKNKIFYNSGENGLDQFGNDKRSNGIDDDNNGFVDDYMGWDFVDRAGVPSDTLAGDFHGWDNMPYDNNKGSLGNHGTLVGGTAGAESNNISGIAGVVPDIKLLNVRSFDNGGNGEEDDAAAAILYAVQMGAKVINMSWGDYTFSYVLRDVIRYAYSQNVVLVGSSGNSSTNITDPHYPSGYPEVISVGNSTENDGRAAGSVYGSTLDLMAPGTSILSTDVNSGYTEYSGTSAAAPHVSAAAALILSLRNFTNEEVKQILKSTSDDIQTPGWDDQTGAGRLNLFRALSVLAPATVKFNFPTMDYATNEKSIEINSTILSPYFISYNLEVGTGNNPANWTNLIEDGRNQFANETIYNLNVSSFPDSVYTLRLLVFQNNGGTLEERINFHIMRTPPEVTEVGLGSLYYGDRSTIAGEFLTNQPSVMRLYYRKMGESDFKFITLDGFNTNNQFVKTQHYGFIPKEIVEPGATYSVYFEAENLAGLKTLVLDTISNNQYFVLQTENLPVLANHSFMPFSLPRGNLFNEPFSFFSDNYNEVFCQLFYDSEISYFGLYKLENETLIKVDSVAGYFPRAFGDFNNNGKKDYISYKAPDIFVHEQSPADTFNLSEKYRSPLPFNVTLVDDMDGDGVFEFISQKDTSYSIWKIESDLTLKFDNKTFYKTYKDTLDSDRNYEFNNYVNNNIIVIDSDNDGKKEIWFVDADGDLIQYVIHDLNNIVKGDSLRINEFSTLKNYGFSAGDYDGNGIKDFAILYYTNSIAPTFLLLVVSFENHQPKILAQQVFLDKSADYLGGLTVNDIYQSLRFVNIDNDSQDEIVLNIFPYVYVFKRSQTVDKIVFFEEGANNPRIFSGDLNQNGTPEIGLRINNEIKFIEFEGSNRTTTPYSIKGYSLDSTSVQLTWQTTGQMYNVFRGSEPNNLVKIDSVFQSEYTNIGLEVNKYYYYAIQAYDPSKPEPLSSLSRTIEVYSHTPGKPVNAVSNSNKSVIVTFTEKMKNVIENLQSFEIPGVGFPNSVSPNNQYSYLISFRDDLQAGEMKLIVKDIKDLYDSPVTTDILNFIVTPSPELETFFISSFEIISPHRIKLTFNFNVDESSAVDAKNYLFDPENKVVSVEVDNTDKNVIYLNLDDRKPIGSIGKEYRLQIVNLRSSVGSGSLNINIGAGSYVVLTSFAKDLSDVYVYPNPANTRGEAKVTFANLPKRAKIVIFSINGDKITEIEEKDGNGGVDFSLSYSSGEKLNSGVYIYRVVMLDDFDNEVDEKIGKFAVIR